MTLVASSSPDATEGSADHFSAPAPPAADDTTVTAPSTTETPTAPPPLHVLVGAKDGTLAASSSPGVALDTADGVTAAAASTSTANTGLDIDTDPVPGVIAPPVTAPPAVDMDTGTRASTVDGTAQSDTIPASADTSAAADDARGPTASGGRRYKRKYAPASTGRRQRRYCSDSTVRASDGGGAQAGGEGGSGA